MGEGERETERRRKVERSLFFWAAAWIEGRGSWVDQATLAIVREMTQIRAISKVSIVTTRQNSSFITSRVGYLDEVCIDIDASHPKWMKFLC